MKKQLLISIDPGFDGIKIVTKDGVYKIPFNVYPVNDGDFNTSMSGYRESYICYTKDTKRFLVGEYAKSIMARAAESGDLDENTKNKLDEFYELERFNSEWFEVGLESAIAYALLQLSQKDSEMDISNLDKDYELFIVIELPHKHMNYKTHISEFLKQKHEYKINIGSNDKKYDFNYTILDKHVIVSSQTISAVHSEILDDTGNLVQDNPLCDLPIVVFDGGYKTFGMIEISENWLIKETKTESNLQYAMLSINKKVAAYIYEKYNFEMSEVEIENKTVDYMNKEHLYTKIINEKDGANKGVSDTVDLIELKKTITKEVCDDLINASNKKYRNMVGVNALLCTGGTGQVYHKFLVDEYVKRTKIFNNSQVVLSKGNFKENEYGPVFAIAIGGFKNATRIINEMNLAGE